MKPRRKNDAAQHSLRARKKYLRDYVTIEKLILAERWRGIGL
jgi:hypothetical protein